MDGWTDGQTDRRQVEEGRITGSRTGGSSHQLSSSYAPDECEGFDTRSLCGPAGPAGELLGPFYR